MSALPEYRVLHHWREGVFARVVAATVVLCHLAVILAPTTATAQSPVQRPAAQEGAVPAATLRQSPLVNLRNTLQEISSAEHGFGTKRLGALYGPRGELAQRRAELQADYAKAKSEFAATAAHIQAMRLPEGIVQRHAQARLSYHKRHQALLEALDALDGAPDLRKAAGSVLQMLEGFPLTRSHQPLDYDALPFGTNNGTQTREPSQSAQELESTAPAAPFTTKSGQDPNLAPTEDVRITPEIEALAASLNNEPVAIYNWVHNEITYLPLHLSLQGSQRTLETRQGNAFDIASLLIALLRAADVPARYRYGTVRIPEAKVRNWLGNLESPLAALNLMGQGGIPSRGLAQGGRITLIELEHIWVEAHVDFYPSRGARNFTPDAWIPLDASFKQYDYSDGVDVAGQVPFDAKAFVDELLDSATIDEDAGTVSGIDPARIESRFQSYLDQVQSHIDTEHPDATVGEVIGTRTIRQRTAPVLAASLPYQPVAQAAPISVLPDSLRGHYEYRFYASPRDRHYDSPAFVFRDSLPSLANTRLSLSFTPATDDDRETIESYLPEPDENGEIDPQDLPDSLPGYLIDLTAEFRRDGEVIHTAGPFAMGTELAASVGITRLTGGMAQATNYPVAGEFHALAINLPGGSGESLTAIKERLTATQAKMASGQFETLTKSDLVGDMLTVAANGYFERANSQLQLLHQTSGGALLAQPGFGAAVAKLSPEYGYGAPRRVEFGGLGLDVDAYAMSVVSAENDDIKRVRLAQQMGTQLSTLEHRTLEVLFSEGAPRDAASTVKALSTATVEGQTIYTLDASNIHYLDQVGSSRQIKTDIRNGAHAGLLATIHKNPVNVGGWFGTGYSLVDPLSGSGAYRIGSGENGGFFLAPKKRVDKVVFGQVVTIGPILGSVMGGPFFAGVRNFIEDTETCLTGQQRATLSHAWSVISQAENLSNFSSNTSPSLAFFAAYTVIVSYIIHFVRMNVALGDCGV